MKPTHPVMESSRRLHIDEKSSNGTTQTSLRGTGSNGPCRITMKSEHDQIDTTNQSCVYKALSQTQPRLPLTYLSRGNTSSSGIMFRSQRFTILYNRLSIPTEGAQAHTFDSSGCNSYYPHSGSAGFFTGIDSAGHQERWTMYGRVWHFLWFCGNMMERIHHRDDQELFLQKRDHKE